MNLQLQREKKRIARIGQASTDVENDHDFMAEIFKAMDFDVGNSLPNAQEKSHIGINNTEKMSLGTANVSVQQKIKMPRPPKKFFPEKKHPLMAKCQRNLKYLKHNRSIPKQRAHISFIPNTPKTHLPKTPIVEASREKKKLSKFVKVKNISNRPSDTFNTDIFSNSGDSDCDKSSLDTDSDSYENFIRAQKQIPPSDESYSESLASTKKHKIKKKPKIRSTSSSKQCNKDVASETDVSDSDFHGKNRSGNSNFLAAPNISRRKLDESDSDSSNTIGRDKSESFATSKRKSKKKSKKRDLSSTNLKYPEISLKRKPGASDISDDNSIVNIDTSNSGLLATSKAETKHQSKKSKKEFSSSNRQSAQQFQRQLNISDTCDDSSSAYEMRFSEFPHSDAFVFEQSNLNSDNDNTIFSGTEKTSIMPCSFDLTNADTKEYISKHFSCSVRIECDPLLDKRAALIARDDTGAFNSDVSSRSVKSIEQSNIAYDSTAPRNDSKVVLLENTSDSDDDCQFLYEVSTPNFSTTNDARIKLNNKSCTDSTISFPHIPVSLQNSPVAGSVNFGNKASSNSLTVDGESKFNIKISSIQSLRETDYSDPSLDISESNANAISTADIAHDTNHVLPEITLKSQTFVSSGSVPVKQSVSETLNHTGEDIKQNNSEVLIPNLDKLLNNIDFDLINQVSKQPVISDASVINKTPHSSAEQRTSMFVPSIENGYNSNHLNVASDTNLLKCVDIDKDDYLKFSTKSNVSDTIDKIDLKNILLIANSKQITDPCVERKKYIEQGYSIENFNVVQPSVIIPEKPKNILLSQDSFWQDLKDAVTVKNCLSNDQYSNSKIESKAEEEHNISLVSHGHNSNRVVMCKNESISVHVDDISKSNADSMVKDRKAKLQVNISKTDPFSVSSVSNQHEIFAYEPETLKVSSINPEEPYECPSDELDYIAATSIRELCEQKQQSISPLFNLYSKELRHYDEIVSTEMNVSAGLRMLEEKQARKVKYLEAAIRNLVQHDPCFQKVKEENCSLFNKTLHADYTKDVIKTEVQRPGECSSEVLHKEGTNLKDTCQSKQEHLQQGKKCDNCGREAKFRCLSCRKAFFCSSQCGIDFWEKEHSVNCT